MSDDKDTISFLDAGDVSRFMNPPVERRQSLKGFDEDYMDIVDYILRCTHKIWEEHGVGLIYSHYSHNISIWTSEGLTYGIEAVVSGTALTKAAFPDVRLYGDDVIWDGDDEAGFHTSHRISWVAHNTGYSKYGPPTGRRIYRFGIANCLVKENRIVEEWISRDELGLIRQLGFNPWKAAVDQLRRESPAPNDDAEGEIDRLQGQPAPVSVPAPAGSGFDPEAFVRWNLNEIWNWRNIRLIDQTHVPNYLFHGPGGRDLYGRNSLKAWILSLLAAFPDLAASVDHVYWNGNDEDGYRVMVRWTLRGTHRGPGIYGTPTGKRINLMVIGHQHIFGGKLVKEWTVFDEFVLLKQLYTPEIHGEFAED